MNTYYAYIRVSTTKQAKGTSLAVQEQLIEKYAKNNNLHICEWFHEVQSAARTNRTQFTKLINKLKRNHANGLIIHTIDRSARNLKDWVMLGELVDAGIDVRFVQENIDLSTRGSRLSADIQAVIAADYIRNLREEARKGIHYRLQQGLYPLPAPLGYINNGSGKVKTIDPLRAPFVEEGFRLYAMGEMSISMIAEHSHKQGFFNTHMRKVSVNAWSNILNNPFYMGTIRVAGKTYPGIHEPLIKKRLFEDVQEVLRQRRNCKKNTHTFLFQRILVCAHCDHKLIGEKQKGHIYYRCHTVGHTVCMREDRILALVLCELKNLQANTQWHNKIKNIISSITNIAPKKKLFSAQKLALYNLNQQKDRLPNLYAQNLISKNELLQKKDELTDQMNMILQQQRIAEKRIHNLRNTETCLQHFLTGKDVMIDTSLKRKSLQKLGMSIVVSDTKKVFISFGEM